MSDRLWQSESEAPVVPERATQGAQTHKKDWTWVEATVWSERMLAALGNGVQRDESLFRGVWIVHHDCNLWTSEPIPMRKPPTGEPCAGEPHARFGGRGRRQPFPDPLSGLLCAELA